MMHKLPDLLPAGGYSGSVMPVIRLLNQDFA
jgi:hypothetical protein